MRTHTLSDSYRHYVADGGELHKTMYKNICQDFNMRIMDHIIYDAGSFNMGSNLSTLSVLRIKRKFSNPSVNWKESMLYRKELEESGEKIYDSKTGEGTKWLIFHTEDWYCRFYWRRKNAKFKNKNVYMFIATKGEKGNKGKLKRHLGENEINYVKYEKSE